MKYDIIGDIHGHADQLRQLLEKLGYTIKDGSYSPPAGRKAIFVGDLIDRGPRIRRTLEIVKSMCDQESALAVLGNHEYNALCYHTKNADREFEWLRNHSCKNVKQHLGTLKEFKNRPQDWQNYMDWFMRLPLCLDLGDIRVVHAAWAPPAIEKMRKWTDCGPTEHPSLTPDLLQRTAQKDSEEYKAFGLYALPGPLFISNIIFPQLGRESKQYPGILINRYIIKYLTHHCSPIFVTGICVVCVDLSPINAP